MKSLPDRNKGFIIRCDASKYAASYILSQIDSNGRERPVYFDSKAFTKVQSEKYPAGQLELFSIVLAINVGLGLIASRNLAV